MQILVFIEQYAHVRARVIKLARHTTERTYVSTGYNLYFYQENNTFCLVKSALRDVGWNFAPDQ